VRVWNFGKVWEDLTALCRTVQKHFDVLNRLGVDRECDGQTGKQTKTTAGAPFRTVLRSPREYCE